MPEKVATLRVPGLKVTVPLKPEMLPRDLVPPEPAPVGEPVLELVLEDGFTARARINGKNYRRLLKQVAEQGAENVVVILQGTLKPPAAKGGPFVYPPPRLPGRRSTRRASGRSCRRWTAGASKT